MFVKQLLFIIIVKQTCHNNLFLLIFVYVYSIIFSQG